ncbi:hypothetical protein B0A48_02545 [Cryoendolithus antarcticus]|uniref:Uncharacterized protein n=1 Tax=Cryoendolithus antarcticus TaxID=1507870 RepID=A0A1V8TP99_9PEZI|nr:hypothetical protein B0A48_02545 [Cryoendolithus antarcticus]
MATEGLANIFGPAHSTSYLGSDSIEIRLLSIFVTIVGITTALPQTIISAPDLEEHPAFEAHSPVEEQAVHSALGRRKTSKPAEEPPKGTYWLEHPDADDPAVQHPKHKKPWTWYPGIDTQCFVDIDDDENGGNKCAAIDGVSAHQHHFLISAVFEFCTQIHGKLSSLPELHTLYMTIYDYWPSSQSKTGERGSILLQVGFARDIDSPKNYTMGYTFCVQNGFLPIVNYCDSKGFNHKRGGYSNYNNEHHGNDRLFWLLDPNPYGAAPLRQRPEHEEHTEPLGYKVDDCRNRWSEDISSADHSINLKDCWDCSNARLDGCTKDDWDAIDNLKNHALSNYDGMTATPLPTATPAARSLALTSDGSFGGVEASVETAVSMTSVPAIAAGDGGFGDAIATMGPPPPKPSS